MDIVRKKGGSDIIRRINLFELRFDYLGMLCPRKMLAKTAFCEYTEERNRHFGKAEKSAMKISPL